jgi:hypothetical protein
MDLNTVIVCGWVITSFYIGRFPQSVVGSFYCRGNPIYSIWNLFKNHSLIEMFNDYDPIRDNKVIILDRLNSFLQEIGQPTVTEDMLMLCGIKPI